MVLNCAVNWIHRKRYDRYDASQADLAGLHDRRRHQLWLGCLTNSVRIFEAGIALAAASAINEDEVTASTLFDPQGRPAIRILAHFSLPLHELVAVELAVASVTRHKVKGLAAELAAPGDALVTLTGRKAFRFVAALAYHVTAAEATFLAGADASHTVLVEAHDLVALEAEEVVEHIWTFAALVMLEELERKLMTEDEKLSGTEGALGELLGRARQVLLALGIIAANRRHK